MKSIAWLVLLSFQPAYAHDWYHDLKVPGTTMSCCNNQDCRVTTAEPRDDGWWAIVDGRWMPVPQSRVLRMSPPDGRSHICANASGILCFIPAESRI